MKVKISSFTPLFFPYTARYVSHFSETTFIQGFIPNKFTISILKLSDTFLKTRILKKALNRLPNDYKGKNIGIGLPELYMHIGFLLLGRKPIILKRAHAFYGWISKFYLSNTDNIFHVRSGSGRGGAIKKAKKLGVIVVTDHSIAHPIKITQILQVEYNKYKVSFEYTNCFWTQIVRDCDEADYILVNSDFVKSSFVENGYNPNKVKVVYLGVREDFWKCKVKYERSEVFSLLFIGGFGFRKGCEYLLKSLEIIEKKGVDFRLTVIGPIVDFDDVIDKYGVDKIDFKGSVLYDDLKNYYAKADVFIFPSLCEGSTMAGMEAMSAGLPCIFTENCGVPVIDKENGLIIPIKDEQAIADAVELLYNNESLRRKIGVNANKTIEENFKWTDYQNNIKAFYEEIINSKN